MTQHNLMPTPLSNQGHGEGNGNPLCSFFLGNPMERGGWQASVWDPWVRQDLNNNHGTPTSEVFFLFQEHHCLCTFWSLHHRGFLCFARFFCYLYLISEVTSFQKFFLTIFKISLAALSIYTHLARPLLQSEMIFLFSFLLCPSSSMRVEVLCGL